VNTPEEIIQAMRTTNVGVVLKKLTNLHRVAKHHPKSKSAVIYAGFAAVFSPKGKVDNPNP
jgi:hypothetical protein